MTTDEFDYVVRSILLILCLWVGIGKVLSLLMTHLLRSAYDTILLYRFIFGLEKTADEVTQDGSDNQGRSDH